MLNKKQVLPAALIVVAFATPANVLAQVKVGVSQRPFSINHQLLSHSIAGGASYPFLAGGNYFFRSSVDRSFTENVSFRAHYRAGILEPYSRFPINNLQGERIQAVNSVGFEAQSGRYGLWGKYKRLYDEIFKFEIEITTPTNPLGTGQFEEVKLLSRVDSYSAGISAHLSRDNVIASIGVDFLTSNARDESVAQDFHSESNMDGGRIIASLNLRHESYSVLLYGASRATLTGEAIYNSQIIGSLPIEQGIPEYIGFNADFLVSERLRLGAGATYVGFESAGLQKTDVIPSILISQVLFYRDVVQVSALSSFEFVKQVSTLSVGAHYSPDIRRNGATGFFTYGDILSLSLGLNYRRDWLGIGLTYVNSSWLSEYDPLTDRLLLTLSTSSVF